MTNHAPVDDLFHQAMEMDKAGQTSGAALLYRKILESEPNHAHAQYLLGIHALRQDKYDEAVSLIQGAIARLPREATFHHFLGQALQARGDQEPALTAYRKTLELVPQHAASLFRCGTVLRSLHRPEEAEQALSAACQADPSMTAAFMQRGEVLVQLGQHDEALDCYDQLLQTNPQMMQALLRIGEILLAQERFTEAQEHYRQLFTMQRGPGMINSVFHEQRTEAPGTDKQAVQVWPFFLENLSQHIDHLITQNKLDTSFKQAGKLLDQLLEETATSARSNKPLTLSSMQAESISNFYDRALHVPDTPPLDGNAINTSLDFHGIEQTYLDAEVPMVHFDDFLAPAALQAINEFCLEATIFYRQSLNGFLSSYVYDGFNCGLLYRIAAELKQCFPRVLGAHELRNMWVYRYPCQGEGVRPHSDQAAVTVNFWITPDSANLDKTHGGLTVYDREQPTEWDWHKTNHNKDSPEMLAKIDNYLQGANTVTIPYQENRALMFHSNLFHASDSFNFRDGYRNRRMNITLLFGDRT